MRDVLDIFDNSSVKFELFDHALILPLKVGGTGYEGRGDEGRGDKGRGDEGRED